MINDTDVRDGDEVGLVLNHGAHYGGGGWIQHIKAVKSFFHHESPLDLLYPLLGLP